MKSGHYIVRNLTDQKKYLSDLYQNTIGLEYWNGFKRITEEEARKAPHVIIIPPLSDIVVEISHTRQEWYGLVSLDGFSANTDQFMVFRPKWYESGAPRTPKLVIINSDIDCSEFVNLFQTYQRIPFKVDRDAEEIAIMALSDDVVEYFACELDFRYIERLPKIKRIQYESIGGDYHTSLDLSLLAKCKTLEELVIESRFRSPIDLTPLLDINLQRLWYRDWRMDIHIDGRGSPPQIHDLILKYQQTTFLEKIKE